MKNPRIFGKCEHQQKGFTLIEILVVIGIIAILAAVVIVALNPGRNFAQANNTQRLANVNAILDAVTQRMTENHGAWTTGGTTGCSAALPSVATTIGSGAGNVDLEPCLVPTYLPVMLIDPSIGAAASTSTGYQIVKNANGRITVSAPNAELDEVISVVR